MSRLLSLFKRLGSGRRNEVENYFEESPKQNNSGYGAYEILVIPGDSDDLVVSCAGVGNMQTNSIHFEFKNSLQNVAPNAHKIFIKDNSRSWYTEPDGRDQVVDFIKSYIKQHEISNSTVLGLSMGGYGALILDSFIGFTHVVALATRSCLGDQVSFDHRNLKLIRLLKLDSFSSLENFVKDLQRVHLVFSIDDQNDLFHAYRVSKILKGVNLHAVRGNHNIAFEYGRRGRMNELVSWMVNSSTSDCPKGFMALSGDVLRVCDNLLNSEYKVKSSIQLNHLINQIEQKNIPAFLFDDFVESRSDKYLIGEAVKQDKLSTYSFVVAENTYLTSKNAADLFPYGWKQTENGAVVANNKWQRIAGNLIDYLVGNKYQLCIRYKFVDEKQRKTKITILQNNQKIQAEELDSQRKFPILKITPLFENNGDFNIMLNVQEIQHNESGSYFQVDGLYFERV